MAKGEKGTNKHGEHRDKATNNNNKHTFLISCLALYCILSSLETKGCSRLRGVKWTQFLQGCKSSTSIDKEERREEGAVKMASREKGAGSVILWRFRREAERPLTIVGILHTKGTGTNLHRKVDTPPHEALVFSRLFRASPLTSKPKIGQLTAGVFGLQRSRPPTRNLPSRSSVFSKQFYRFLKINIYKPYGSGSQ